MNAETLQSSKFEELVEIISAHYDSKSSFIVQRLKFYNRVRASGESIAAFVASLGKIAEHCEYKDSLKDMLRDRLVCGVNHDGIQQKLLAEKNLTYDKALEIALTMETAEQGTKYLKAQDKLPAPSDLQHTPQKFKQQRATGKTNAKTPSTVICHRCLGEQLATPVACANFVPQNVSCVRRWDILLKLVSLNRKVEKVTKTLQNPLTLCRKR